MSDERALWTPGPWEIYHDNCGACEGEWCLSGAASAGPHGGWDLPTARLISAAPELYEALDALLTSMSEVCRTVDLQVIDDEINRARSALKKARGEA